jgi:hypothetical protein
MTLLTFILASYGMTMILVYGSIFRKIRPSHEFFHCPLCVGFWVGVWNWVMLPVAFNVFVAGCISAGTSYFLCSLMDDEGLAVKVKDKHE